MNTTIDNTISYANDFIPVNYTQYDLMNVNCWCRGNLTFKSYPNQTFRYFIGSPNQTFYILPFSIDQPCAQVYNKSIVYSQTLLNQTVNNNFYTYQWNGSFNIINVGTSNLSLAGNYTIQIWGGIGLLF